MDLSRLLLWAGHLPLRWRFIQAPRDLPFRDVTFPARDGVELSGWYVPHAQARGAVILCHGIYSTRMAVLSKARLLHQWGYAALLFDFRGRGRSQGECTTGFHEPLDVLGGMDFLRDQPELMGLPLGGLGESLGASSLLSAMAQDGGLRCASLEACFASLEEAVAARCPRRYLPAITANLEQKHQLPITEVNPLRHVAQIHQPLLLIHNQLDWSLGVGVARRLAQAAAGPSQLWVARRTLHTRAALMAAQEYRYRVGSFFADHLR